MIYKGRIKMSNKVFDILRTLCEIVIPALGTLYFALAKIWHLPYGTEIVGTCAALATFIGAIVGVNRASFNAVEKSVDAYIINQTKEDTKE